MAFEYLTGVGVIGLTVAGNCVGNGTTLILLRNWREFTRVERVHYGTVLVAMVAFVGWVN